MHTSFGKAWLRFLPPGENTRLEKLVRCIKKHNTREGRVGGEKGFGRNGWISKA
jgi:hypothetical protein